MLIGSDGSAEVPDDDVFSLECYLDYEVQGESIEVDHSPPVRSESQSKALKLPASHKKTFSGYKHRGSKPPGVMAKEVCLDHSTLKKKEVEWKKNIDICTYDGVMVKKVSNFPINLTNETARLEFISSSVSHELFQGKEVILVDVDNLKIMDSTVTRGLFL